METKSAASLLLLPLLLQLVVVFAAPVVVRNANSTSQTCDNTESNQYTVSILNIRGKLASSRPRIACSQLLTTMFPGQTISPTFCSAKRTLVGKYSPLPIPEHIERANKLFEEEGSGAEEPERFCPSMIELTFQSHDIVEGADFSLYKLPEMESNTGEIYTVTVTERKSGKTVITKNVSDSASGWQITDISTYARTKSFRRRNPFFFNIYVKRSDGSHLTCQEMKKVFALDCAVAQERNNFPFTDNILPALAVYNSGEFIFDPFKFLFGKRSIKQKLRKLSMNH